MIQEALNDNNQQKEVEPRIFMCMESIENLTRPKLGERCFSYEKFKSGILQQVSSGTYGLRLSYNEDTFDINGGDIDILYPINDDANCLISIKAGHAVILMHRGQPIPKEGLQKMFYIKHKDEYDSGGLEDGGASVVAGKTFSTNK